MRATARPPTERPANLLANSIKFNRDPPAPVLLEVRARRTTHTFRVEFVDHGRGMAPEDLEIATAVTVRGRNATGTPGSGLGLSICRRIVEGRGGTLGLRPTAGGGLIVWFEIPVTPTD